MKITRSFTGVVLALGIAAVTVAWAQGAFGQGSAKVVRVVGDAQAITAGNERHPLKPGDIVKPGTVLQTASGSQVDLVLGNSDEDLGRQILQPSFTYRPEGNATANAIRMFSDTTLSLDKLSSTQTGADTVTETQLDLRTGKIFGTVKKMAGASKYEVKYPNGVAGIKGAVFLMRADGTTSVYSGAVVLAYLKAGQTVTRPIDAGYMFDAPSETLIPIGQSRDYSDLLAALKQVGALPSGAPPSAFAPDRTYQWLSPTIGSKG